ncbi:hypothetical protein G6011_11482, partial [Alternaria panax]
MAETVNGLKVKLRHTKIDRLAIVKALGKEKIKKVELQKDINEG